MNNRYSPWWMPVAIIALLFVVVLQMTLLVVKKTDSAAENPNQDFVKTDSTEPQKIYKWKLVTSWPKKFPGLGLAPEIFVEKVRKMSNGRLDITVYGANQIVPPLGVFGAVQSGAAEMGHSGSYYWKGKIPAAVFFTTVPFGMNAQEFNGWLHYGGGLDLWREIYADFNLVPFAGGNTGVQMGGWFNKEINSAEDIKGLKMRIPGLGGEVFSRAGGEAVNIPGGELFTSLQSGLIDATEWVGPYNDLAFGFHQIAKYYYYPGWHEPGSSMEFTVNKKLYDSLPEDLQTIIEVAARAVNQEMIDEYTARNNNALNDLLNKHQVELRRFPDDVIAKMRVAADEIYTEMAAKDETFNKVYKSYKTYLDGIKKYHSLSEQAYYNLR